MTDIMEFTRPKGMIKVAEFEDHYVNAMTKIPEVYSSKESWGNPFTNDTGLTLVNATVQDGYVKNTKTTPTKSVPIMSSDNDKGFTVFASNVNPDVNYGAFAASDGVIDTDQHGWASDSGVQGNVYIGFYKDSLDPIVVQSVKIYPFWDVTALYQTNPQNVIFQGSNDNSDWKDIKSHTFGVWSRNTPKEVVLDNTMGYKYYRMYIINNYGWTVTAIQEIEWNLGGVIIPSMSSDNSRGWSLTASGWNSYEPYYSFNGETDTPEQGWFDFNKYDASGNPLTAPSWVTANRDDLTEVSINGITLYPKIYNGAPANVPKVVTFRISDDNTNWTDINTTDFDNNWTIGVGRTVTFDKVYTGKYLQVRIDSTNTAFTYPPSIAFAEINWIAPTIIDPLSVTCAEWVTSATEGDMKAYALIKHVNNPNDDLGSDYQFFFSISKDKGSTFENYKATRRSGISTEGFVDYYWYDCPEIDSAGQTGIIVQLKTKQNTLGLCPDVEIAQTCMAIFDEGTRFESLFAENFEKSMATLSNMATGVTESDILQTNPFVNDAGLTLTNAVVENGYVRNTASDPFGGNSWSPSNTGIFDKDGARDTSLLYNPNNDLVYQFGGRDSAATNYTDILSKPFTDINDNTVGWTSAGKFPTSELSHTCAFIRGTKLYLIGGIGTGGVYYSSVYETDLSLLESGTIQTSDWSVKGATPTTACAWVSVAQTDTSICIVGGQDNSNNAYTSVLKMPVATFDAGGFVAGDWVASGGLPNGGALRGGSLVAVEGNYVIIGGNNGSTSYTIMYKKSFSDFENDTGSWVSAGSLPTPSLYGAGSFVANNKVYTGGGRDNATLIKVIYNQDMQNNQAAEIEFPALITAEDSGSGRIMPMIEHVGGTVSDLLDNSQLEIKVSIDNGVTYESQPLLERSDLADTALANASWLNGGDYSVNGQTGIKYKIITQAGNSDKAPNFKCYVSNNIILGG